MKNLKFYGSLCETDGNHLSAVFNMISIFQNI